MANINRCGCSGRRNSDSFYGCLNSLNNRGCWDSPYYGGPCPDAGGRYGCDGGEVRGRDDREDRGCGRRRCRYGVFTAMLPMAVAPNGVIPLVNSNCVGGFNDFPVNSGLVTIDEKGTYLATYTVRVPEGEAVASTLTLNVNDASQSSAVAEVGGEGPTSFTAQSIFEVGDRATLTLRSSEAISLTQPSTQPLVTLSLVRLDEE